MLCVLWQVELCVLATTCYDELGEPTLHSSQVHTHAFCMSNVSCSRWLFLYLTETSYENDFLLLNMTVFESHTIP